MSIAATNCPSCGLHNTSSAKFCGGCGTSVSSTAQPATYQPQSASASRPFVSQDHDTTSSKQDDPLYTWGGLICGVLSILFCGPFTAIPGAFMCWKSISDAKAMGNSPAMGTIGLGLCAVGLLMTLFVGMMSMLLMVAGGM